MDDIDSFRIRQPFLTELLEAVEAGRVHYAEPRRHVLEDDRTTGEIVGSIARGLPIGALTLLELGGDDSGCRSRAFPGAGRASPTHLVLDGERRLAALHEGLRMGIASRESFYMNMRWALERPGDMASAIVRGSHEIAVAEHEREWFPLYVAFDEEMLARWMTAYAEQHAYDPSRMRFSSTFKNHVVRRLQHYRVPIIDIVRGTPPEIVRVVLEAIRPA